MDTGNEMAILGQERQHLAQMIGLLVTEQPVYDRMRILPCRQRFDEERMSSRRQGKTAAAPILLVDRYLDEAALFERLQIGGKRRPVHGQELRNLSDARRLRPVEAHQQRELSMSQIHRPHRIVEPSRQRARRTLHGKTQAMVAHMMRCLRKGGFSGLTCAYYVDINLFVKDLRSCGCGTLRAIN